MAFNTYATLKTAIGNWLARSDLTSYLDDFITLGEERLARDLRIRQTETALSGTTSGGVLAVPTDFLELKYAYISGTPVYSLDMKDAWWIYREYPNRSAESKPFFIAVDAGNFIFGPYPDKGYTVEGTYWKKPATCVGGTTNEWTDYTPDALLFASLIETAPFLAHDERMLTWMAKYEEITRGYQSQDKRNMRHNARVVNA